MSGSTLPLEGLMVVDFSQFLAGPVAALRLADLGARVIKIERPGTGDIGRHVSFADMEIDGSTLPFHVFNRGKQSIACDLKDRDDASFVRELIGKADVSIHNFRPGVMERLGFDYETVRDINPRIVYGTVSGYGSSGPWRDHPGQDLLAQARAGLPWLNGNRDMGPIPVGIAVADVLAAAHLATGVIACLHRRDRTGEGGLVETSLLEAMIDLQMEAVSAHLTDPAVLPRRGGANTAHSFLPAPYGLYPTKDGHIAIAMGSVAKLGELLGVEALLGFQDPDSWLKQRDEITTVIAQRLFEKTTADWLAILIPAGIWCGPLYRLDELVEHEGFAVTSMTQKVSYGSSDGAEVEMELTRIPIRIDGIRPAGAGSSGAPRLGADSESIRQEFAK